MNRQGSLSRYKVTVWNWSKTVTSNRDKYVWQKEQMLVSKAPVSTIFGPAASSVNAASCLAARLSLRSIGTPPPSRRSNRGSDKITERVMRLVPRTVYLHARTVSNLALSTNYCQPPWRVSLSLIAQPKTEHTTAEFSGKQGSDFFWLPFFYGIFHESENK